MQKVCISGGMGRGCRELLEVPEYGRNKGMRWTAVSYQEVPEIGRSERLGGAAVSCREVQGNIRKGGGEGLP